MRLALLIALWGCKGAPYPEYWEDPANFPEISGITTAPSLGLLGGHELILHGARLDTTKTVVVGTRNAEIIEVTPTEVTVVLPHQPAGAGAKDIVVVTDFGYTRFDALDIESHLGDWGADEVWSAALTQYDCPIEAYGQYEKVRYPMWWCGAEFGWAEAVAWVGIGSQEGVAGDLAEVGALSMAPLPGEVALFGPKDRRPPMLPVLADYHSAGDAIILRTPRDFERDLAYIEAREALVDDYYYWVDGIDSWYGPRVQLYDDEMCYFDAVEVVDAIGDELVLAEAPGDDVQGIWLGFGFQESYEDDPEIYVTEAWTATAEVELDGDRLIGESSGVELLYDEGSGYYFGVGVAELVGQSDMPFGETYTVSSRKLDKEDVLGEIRGGDELVVTRPDLDSGRGRIRLDKPLVVEWEPAPPTDDPAIIVMELVLYDAEIDDPNYMTELFRLVASQDDLAGSLEIDAGVLQALPQAPNRIDGNDEQTGIWAEMNVVRHQFRKVDVSDGDLIVDFMHVKSSPLQLKRP